MHGCGLKQGTKFRMPIKLGMDLSQVDSIRFKFAQCGKERIVEYPSDKAIRRSARIIDIIWEESDTWQFEAEKPIALDTKINLIDSAENPCTEIVSFELNKTLFKQGE